MILSYGPDTLTTCASNYGGILELNAEYLVGVGGPCSAFNEWQLLSTFTDEDLKNLRELAEKKLDDDDDDGNHDDDDDDGNHDDDDDSNHDDNDDDRVTGSDGQTSTITVLSAVLVVMVGFLYQI